MSKRGKFASGSVRRIPRSCWKWARIARRLDARAGGPHPQRVKTPWGQMYAVGALLVVGCEGDMRDGPDTTPESERTAKATVTAPALSALASASASSVVTSSAPTANPSANAAVEPSPCREGMVMVEGDYCPEVEQNCIKYHPEFEADLKKKAKAEAKGQKYKSTVSERCLEYQSPTKCLSSERKRLRFCVDRFEFPNKKGELPSLLVSWTEAKAACATAGKRLCTEEEFNFACEGPEMLPYTYGYVRDASKCSIDKEYRKRSKKLFRYAKCMDRPACKAHLAELDQRLPAGSLPECVSPFGVFDMNGNINEWVEIPRKEYPDRSGLKGGWWGPVRGRCRPTVDFHKEDDFGYEEGFRCCADP